MRPSEPLSTLDRRTWRALVASARERLQRGPERLRSRATLVHAVALLVLIGLCVFDVSGMPSLVIVLGLAVLLRLEHLRGQRDVAPMLPDGAAAATEDAP